MIKIILVDNDERNYLTLKSIIGKLDFLYTKNLVIKWYKTYNCELNDTINDCGIKKIYLINNRYQLKEDNLANYIRNIDYHSELILLGKKYRSWIKNIFDFIPNIYEYPKKILLDLKQILDNYYIGKMFKYKNRKYSLSIYYENILYIYRDTCTRKAVIVTDNNEFYLGIPLNEIKILLDNRFCQVHRACFLNICRVQEYNWANNYFILDNGNKIDLLSKKYRYDIERI